VEKRDGWNLMSVLAKAVECGDWERDARVMEASIGRSGRQARTSRNWQGAHRPASALNTRMGCLIVELLMGRDLGCLLLGPQLHISSYAIQISRGMRDKSKRKGNVLVYNEYELVRRGSS
jgi:hypothetical protein